MEQQHTLVFPVEWNGRAADLSVTFTNRGGSRTVVVSHTIARNNGREVTRESYANPVPDDGGMYRSGRNLLDGQEMTRDSVNWPRDESFATYLHVIIELNHDLNVPPSEHERYAEQVAYPIAAAVGNLADDRNILRGIPDGARLKAVNAWDDFEAQTVPDWELGTVRLYRLA